MCAAPCSGFWELRTMTRARFLGSAVAVTATLLGIGCSSGSNSNVPVDFQGDGITSARIVTPAHHDVSEPLRDMVLRAKAERDREESSNDPDRLEPGKESADKVPFKLPRHTRPLISQRPDPMVHSEIRD